MMPYLMRKLYVFLKKGFLIDVSYKMSFVMMLFNTLFQVFVFYFIGKIIGASALPYLGSYGGDYFAFVLIGIAFTRYSRTTLNALPDLIREEQMMGTLEAILSTPTRVATIVLDSSVWDFVYATLEVLVCLMAGVFLFGFSFEGANFFGTAVIIVLTITSLIGLGLASAGLTLIIKKGKPIAQLFSMFSDVIAGVYFPLTVLPTSLQQVSAFIPLTYSLDALRLLILRGYTLGQVMPQVVALIAFSILLTPLGLLFVDYSLRKAKEDGSLMQY